MPAARRRLNEVALREIVELGVATPFETELIHQDGSLIPVLVGGARLSVDPPSGPGFVLDLTQQKRAKSQLRRAEEELQQLVEETLSALGRADGLPVPLEEAQRLALGQRRLDGRKLDAGALMKQRDRKVAVSPV